MLLARCCMAMVLALALTACSGGGSRPNSETPFEPAESATIEVKLFPAFSDAISDYALQEASTRMPLVVTLDGLGVRGRFVSARLAAGGDRLTLLRLAADITFDIVLTDATGAQKSIHVHALPPDFPKYTVASNGQVAEGDIYIGLFTGLALANPTFNLILTADGTPTYFKRLDHPAINFQKIVYSDGRVRYAYFDQRFPPQAGKGSADGDVVLLDQSFREIRRLRLVPFRSHGPLPSENHDFIFFDDDHYVLSAYDVRTVDLTAFGGKGDSKVSAAIVQEVDHGNIVWEWDSTDYAQLYGASVDGNDFTNASAPIADYLHFNSVEFDPVDRTFLLSFRHLDAVIKIAPFEPHPSGSIAIKWILGGKLDQFGITPAQRFYHQHDARVVSHQGRTLQLSLFDNNNGHYDERPSAAMVFTVDERAMTADLADEYHDAMQSGSQGSVQALGPRHYFIGWGSDSHVSEAVAGTRVFLIGFDNGFVYRARKVR
jgi:arylsulfotransferase ASST